MCLVNGKPSSSIIRPSFCFCGSQDHSFLIFFILYTSANNSSSLPTSSTPKRRLKSRWEPVPEEKVTEKVEPLAKALMNGNAHNNLKAQNTMVSTGMLLLLKFCHQTERTEWNLHCYLTPLISKLSLSIYALSHACIYALASSFSEILNCLLCRVTVGI